MSTAPRVQEYAYENTVFVHAVFEKGQSAFGNQVCIFSPTTFYRFRTRTISFTFLVLTYFVFSINKNNQQSSVGRHCNPGTLRGTEQT